MARKKEEGYVSYQHVEKLASREVGGLLTGDVYVFPKIDGTNAHVWWDGINIQCGSRTRTLSPTSDNAGFYAWVMGQEKLKGMAMEMGGYHIFGEWLVPHTLKTYDKQAWRQFYVFDITYEKSGEIKHLHYDRVAELCEEYGVEYIPPLRIIKNPEEKNLIQCLEENFYLIEDGNGKGEGVVLKNYDYVNPFGRQVWAKIVTSDFKTKHRKNADLGGAPRSVGTIPVEQRITDKFLTDDIIDKVFANLSADHGWRSQYIPRLLQTIWYDFIREHAWDMVKTFKNPTINYKKLNQLCMIRAKQHLTEVF